MSCRSQHSQQAKALGDSYTDIHLDAIITSDLKRARATAKALNNPTQSRPSRWTEISEERVSATLNHSRIISGMVNTRFCSD
ncbi:hypothetical protein JVU11DRAFT_3354 [Chiua virens]|nr:hypothetical protein JVU11DRAFT_3354 [Chiua virens]